MYAFKLTPQQSLLLSEKLHDDLIIKANLDEWLHTKHETCVEVISEITKKLEPFGFNERDIKLSFRTIEYILGSYPAWKNFSCAYFFKYEFLMCVLVKEVSDLALKNPREF